MKTPEESAVMLADFAKAGYSREDIVARFADHIALIHKQHEQSGQQRIEAARAAAYLAGLRAAKRAVIDAMVGKSVDTPLTQIADIAWRAVQRLINAAEAIEEAAKR